MDPGHGGRLSPHGRDAMNVRGAYEIRVLIELSNISNTNARTDSFDSNGFEQFERHVISGQAVRRVCVR
jgi:hypothetical protein